MKWICLAAALSLASMPASAQTMDPAAVEAEAASSSGGIIVPLLGLLIFLAVVSGGSGAPVIPD